MKPLKKINVACHMCNAKETQHDNLLRVSLFFFYFVFLVD